MKKIFTFTLSTKTKYYEKGELIFDKFGNDIGRILRCLEISRRGSDTFYSYDIESNEETYQKLQKKEIELYMIPAYSVYPSYISYYDEL